MADTHMHDLLFDLIAMRAWSDTQYVHALHLLRVSFWGGFWTELRHLTAEDEHFYAQSWQDSHRLVGAMLGEALPDAARQRGRRLSSYA